MKESLTVDTITWNGVEKGSSTGFSWTLNKDWHPKRATDLPSERICSRFTAEIALKQKRTTLRLNHWGAETKEGLKYEVLLKSWSWGRNQFTLLQQFVAIEKKSKPNQNQNQQKMKTKTTKTKQKQNKWKKTVWRLMLGSSYSNLNVCAPSKNICNYIIFLLLLLSVSSAIMVKFSIGCGESSELGRFCD